MANRLNVVKGYEAQIMDLRNRVDRLVADLSKAERIIQVYRPLVDKEEFLKMFGTDEIAAFISEKVA